MCVNSELGVEVKQEVIVVSLVDLVVQILVVILGKASWMSTTEVK